MLASSQAFISAELALSFISKYQKLLLEQTDETIIHQKENSEL